MSHVQMLTTFRVYTANTTFTTLIDRFTSDTPYKIWAFNSINNMALRHAGSSPACPYGLNCKALLVHKRGSYVTSSI